MTMRSYFPLALQTSAAACQRLQLTPSILAPPPGKERFALRQVAAAMQSSFSAAAPGGAQLNLLAQLSRAFRFISVRSLTALPAFVPGDDFAATATVFLQLYPPARLAAEGPVTPVEIAAELFILAAQSQNPAAKPLLPLFDPGDLDAAVPWRQAVQRIDRQLLPPVERAGGEKTLLQLLLEPLFMAPDSLVAQLRYVGAHWADLLPPEFLDEMNLAFALVAEEEATRGGGPGPSAGPIFSRHDTEEVERFSADSDWMPHVVLIAKTVYVWLDQLSRLYQRSITRLDEIPDEELELLAQRGFTSLWLIGLWERSTASAIIKQRMGNHDAVASAYSLYDYVVAADLGGEEALERLTQRCRQRGLRLACDVVPNHTGIDSLWSQEHPDWFIQVDHPPYPAYAFNGPNLSTRHGLELYIDDGYWDHRDAAVVFKHVQHGRTRYIYHGNDGTHLPWNDTAQLNFLREDVREAMICTILAVARRFKIIRFDAAMTLAKKHFERLWFPLPGAAGVPSRAEHTLSRDEFERLFPVEFWRQVVDRVAAEVPDTLLLAEAFWLMEGYFVRTLGMHRVYNSAFMNMLKREENGKYRGVIRQILEFDSGILQRFVNFMNNPDEETAVAQFGKGDKYFAVATLLATMPGLPMFGHGQIDGFEEKYGMEYRRARHQESPDAGFISYHEKTIFPLLRRRPLFSGADAFYLYDFLCHGSVNDNVFAYSNRHGAERSLVIVHNAHGEIAGVIGPSSGKRIKEEGGERLVTLPLSAGLGLEENSVSFWRFRDAISDREYLRRHEDLLGNNFAQTLGSYGVHVFVDWQGWAWDEHLAALCTKLGGRPVADLDRELIDLRFAPEQAALRRLLSPESLGSLLDVSREKTVEEEILADFFLLFCQQPHPLPAALRQLVAAKGGSLSLRVWALLRQGSVQEDLPAHFAARGLDRILGEILGDPSAPALYWRLWRQRKELVGTPLPELFSLLCEDPSLRTTLNWHVWEEKTYVDQSALTTLMSRLEEILVFELIAAEPKTSKGKIKVLRGAMAALAKKALASGYQVEKFCDFE
jgi:glycosidase